MASSLDKLRLSFDEMTTAQKKAYIEKMEIKAKSMNNPLYTKFLNECIQKYTAEVRRNSAMNPFDDFDDFPDLEPDIAEPAERLIAYLFDYLLNLPILVIYFIKNYIVTIISIFEYDYKIILIINLIELVLTLLYSIVVLVIEIGYWKQGTSFGKSKRGLVVVNKETGTNLSLGYMFLRESVGKFISAMVFLLGFIWILIDKDKQAWHDKLVSSVVVKK